MPIPRMHLFELEDQPWFPVVIRDLATDYLHFMETKLALERPVVPLMEEALQITGEDQVIDLCSGGGGPTLRLQKALADAGRPVRFILTDRYPNQTAFQEVSAASQGTITFEPESIDARAVPERLRGLRTLFNAFHHFRPEEGVAILRDAAQAGQPIGILEFSNRVPGTLIPMLFLTPLMVLVATLFIRPFRWRRLLWTYLIPLVPLTCWWDGIVSQLRAYTPAELERMAEATGAADYTWRAGKVPISSTPGKMTYLLGYPNAKN